MNKIKIELFDKCHEMVYEYMKDREANDRTWIELDVDEFHTRHGELMQMIFKELSGDVVAFYQEPAQQTAIK